MPVKAEAVKEQESKDLIKIEVLDPQVVFKGNGIDDLISQVKSRIKYEHDENTPEGREERRSLAYTIARTKTAVDTIGKDYVAELKKVTTAIDGKRRTWRDTMEALQETVRKPLTEYENKEKQRIAAHQANIQTMRDAMNLDYEPTVYDVEQTIERVRKIADNDFEEFSDQAKTVAENTIGRLGEKLAHLLHLEEQAKELAELKRKEAERQKQEEIERIKREAAEEERRKIQREQEETQKAAEAPAQDPEPAPQAEPAPEKVEPKNAPEDYAVDANKEYKRKVNRAIVQSLMDECLLSESAAQEIVKTVALGKIPNMQINY